MNTVQKNAGMLIAACAAVGIKNGGDFNDVIEYIYAHQDEFFTVAATRSDTPKAEKEVEV